MRALAIQLRKISRMPILCMSKGGSNASLSSVLSFDAREAAVKMVKSLGGSAGTDKMLANLAGWTKGRTLFRTDITARWTLADPV